MSAASEVQTQVHSYAPYFPERLPASLPRKNPDSVMPTLMIMLTFSFDMDTLSSRCRVSRPSGVLSAASASLLRSPRRSFGRTACYASGDAKEFARVAELFLKRDFSQTTFKTAVL